MTKNNFVALTREEAQQVLDAVEKIAQGCQDVRESSNVHKDAKDLARLIRIDCRESIELLQNKLKEDT